MRVTRRETEVSSLRVTVTRTTQRPRFRPRSAPRSILQIVLDEDSTLAVIVDPVGN